MRPLLLLFLTASIMIGLPRLADRFRDAKTLAGAPEAAEARPEVITPSSKAPQSDPATGGLTQQPAPSTAVSVALQSPQILSLPAPAQPPATGEELSLAIQTELIRLGLYRGPASTAWTKPVRFAARRFIRHSNLAIRRDIPTSKLLTALKTTEITDKTLALEGTSLTRLEPAHGSFKPEGSKGAGSVSVDDRTRHRESIIPGQHRRHRLSRRNRHRHEIASRSAGSILLPGF